MQPPPSLTKADRGLGPPLLTLRPRLLTPLLSFLGGIGEAVSSAVVGEPGITVTHLAVNRVPRSGKPAELLKMFGIDKDAIAQAVKGLITKA